MKTKQIVTITGPDVKGEPEITPGGLVIKNSLLLSAVEVKSVDNVEERNWAIEISGDIQTHVKAVEKDMKDICKPHKDLVSKVKSLFDEHVGGLVKERIRINSVIGEFEDKLSKERELDKNERVGEYQKAEENFHDAINEARSITGDSEETLAQILDAEMKIEEAKCKLNTAGNELFDAENDVAKGGSLRHDWKVEVHDIGALYAHCPRCVKLTPILSEIKMQLELGRKLPGVTGSQTTTFATHKTRI